MTTRQTNPFGETSPASRRKAAIAGSAILAAAAVTAWLMTRSPRMEEPAAGHNHGSAAVAPAAMPVTLSADQANRIGVTYAVATVSPLSREIRTVGQVTFDETRVTTISPKVEGWVERLIVNFTGQPVQRGQALFTIYSPMLVSAQEELLLARRLTSDIAGGTSEARANAEEMIQSARRRLAYWDISPSEITAIERTGQVRKTLTLRSPYSGYVLEKNVVEGQRVMMGDALYKLADLSELWLEGEVFERDLPSVRLGQSVTAEFEGLAGEQRTGRITYIYPTVNPETRTARVRVAVANPGMRLKPGMYATLRMNTTSSLTTLAIPRSAVLQTGERTLVFVKSGDGKLQPREVKVGRANGERIEVMSGLSPGDTVVASATFLVDAESNLSSLTGGMGNMPGMDMGPTVKTAPPPPSGKKE
jgi:Cu(I)/Ag(I) efflux system membrane fusion protein